MASKKPMLPPLLPMVVENLLSVVTKAGIKWKTSMWFSKNKNHYLKQMNVRENRRGNRSRYITSRLNNMASKKPMLPPLLPMVVENLLSVVTMVENYFRF
jgi:hypothetical protein